MYEWLICIVCDWYVLYANDENLYEFNVIHFGIMYKVLCIGTLSMKT